MTIPNAQLPAPTAASKHIWVISGPAGCGKTSVAQHVQQFLAIPYLEGDAFHTSENILKMTSGRPLNDVDRWDWLAALREEALLALNTNRKDGNERSVSGVVVTCSALKRTYRDVIRIASRYDRSVNVHFLLLRVDSQLLLDRVRAREGHYMKEHMVATQLACQEMPQEDESDVVSVEASGTPEEVQRLVTGVVKGILASD